jgi:hypothetical protein
MRLHSAEMTGTSPVMTVLGFYFSLYVPGSGFPLSRE